MLSRLLWRPSSLHTTVRTLVLTTAKPASRLISESPNRDICDLLESLALMERNKGQYFKERAYQKAMRSIAAYPKLLSSGKEARDLPGVGESIAKKIDQFLETGSVEQLLMSPASQEETNLLNLFQRVSGIGVVAAKKFVDKGYKSLEDLSNDPNLTHHQCVGLKYVDEFEKEIPRDEMENLLAIVKKTLNEIDSRYNMEACGSFRRGANISGDLDIILTHPDFTEVEEKVVKRHKATTPLLAQAVQALEKYRFLTDFVSTGNVKYMGVCQFPGTDPRSNQPYLHRRIDLRFIPHENYYTGLLAWTGDDELNRIMRSRAKELGYTLNEYGLRRRIKTETGEETPGEKIPINSEEDVFKKLGMPYMEPHERNLRGVVKKKYLMYEE